MTFCNGEQEAQQEEYYMKMIYLDSRCEFSSRELLLGLFATKKGRASRNNKKEIAQTAI